MTVLTGVPRTIPTIARLGFDNGWLLLKPSFLNLGLPILFVDHRLLGPPAEFGLQPFASWDPNSPLPVASVAVAVLGNGVSLWSCDPKPRLFAWHWFDTQADIRIVPIPAIGILCGDSYSVELSWSALWSCHIGAVIPSSA